jgi:hypothetical protein
LKRTIKLGRMISPALKENRDNKAMIVGIVSEDVVLIQKKGCERELCKTKELYLEEEEFNIKGMSQEEIDTLIPACEKKVDMSSDFDRFKQGLARKIEAEVLKDMKTA